MPTGDWIPAKENNLAVFAQNLITSANGTGIGSFGTSTVFQAIGYSGSSTLQTDLNSFSAAASVSLNHATRSKSNVATTKIAKLALVAALRNLAKQIQSNPNTSNAARAALGLPVRGNLPTVPAAPTTAPIVTATPASSGQILVRLADTSTPTKRKRPFGYRGMQLFTQVGGSAPTGTASMHFAALITKAKVHYAAGSNALGQPIYLAGRWYNAAGKTGPDSAVTISIVPL